MRFGVMAAAAAALLCAGQASAARYYEFLISGTTAVTYYDPFLGTPSQVLQTTSTITAFFDSQITSPDGYYATGDGLFVAYGPFGGVLRTRNTGGGTTFNLTVDPTSIGSTLAGVGAAGSYGFTTCDRYGCRSFFSGDLTSVLARTFDGPAISPIVGETITTAAVAVPEPSGWLLMIAGIGSIGYAVRRHRPKRRSALLIQALP